MLNLDKILDRLKDLKPLSKEHSKYLLPVLTVSVIFNVVLLVSKGENLTETELNDKKCLEYAENYEKSYYLYTNGADFIPPSLSFINTNPFCSKYREKLEKLSVLWQSLAQRRVNYEEKEENLKSCKQLLQKNENYSYRIEKNVNRSIELLCKDHVVCKKVD